MRIPSVASSMSEKGRCVGSCAGSPAGKLSNRSPELKLPVPSLPCRRALFVLVQPRRSFCTSSQKNNNLQTSRSTRTRLDDGLGKGATRENGTSGNSKVDRHG
jgi:hypothetical protein